MPRPFSGYNIPISIQSFYLKDYANKKNFTFSLPSTEITNSDNFYMLSKILSDTKLKNLAMTSIFILPVRDSNLLTKIFKAHAKKNINLHFPLEGKILSIKELLEYCKEINIISSLGSEYSILSAIN